VNRRTALGLLAVGAVGACRRTSGVHPTIRVVVAPNISATPLYVADELGFFADEGFDVHTQVIGESLQMVPLVAAGRADVAFSSVTPAAINIVAKGARVRVVAARDAAVLGCTHEIHGRRTSFPNGFGHAAELRGKRVAVTAATSLTAFVLDLLLESACLQTLDVQRLMMRHDQSTAALLAGQLDAAVDMDRNFSSPDIIPGPSLAELVPGFQYSHIQFGERLLDGDPGLGTAFLRAYLRGVREYRGGATPLSLSRLAADAAMHPAAVQSACRERLPEDGRVDRTTVQRMIDWSVRNGFVNQPMDAAQIIDTRFLEWVATRTS